MDGDVSIASSASGGVTQAQVDSLIPTASTDYSTTTSINTLVSNKLDNLIVASVTGTSLLNSTTLKRLNVTSEFTVTESAQVVDIGIDLSSYATTSYVTNAISTQANASYLDAMAFTNTRLANYTTTTALNTLLGNKQDSIVEYSVNGLTLRVGNNIGRL